MTSDRPLLAVTAGVNSSVLLPGLAMASPHPSPARLMKMRHLRSLRHHHLQHFAGGAGKKAKGKATTAAATPPPPPPPPGANVGRRGATAVEEAKSREAGRAKAREDHLNYGGDTAREVDDDMARPWCTLRSAAYVLLALPTALHETPESQLDLRAPTLTWRLSFWDRASRTRLCDDATPHVAVRPAAGNGGATRVLRFDVPANVDVATVRLEIVDGTSTVAYGSLYLHLHTAPPQSRQSGGQGGSQGGGGASSVGGGASSPSSAAHSTAARSNNLGHVLAATNWLDGGRGTPAAMVAPQVGDSTFHLVPLCTASTPAALFNAATDQPQLLAPFAATLVCHSAPLRTPVAAPVASLALKPADMLLPGRNELYISVSNIINSMALPKPGSQFTLLVVLSHGNGELAIGPQVLGSACVDDHGSWFGDWHRMVRLQLPQELCQPHASAATSAAVADLHLLFYLLTTHPAPPSSQQGGDADGDTQEDRPVAVLPVVSAFAYLMLQRQSGLFLASGMSYLRVYRGSPPFLPCVADGTPLFCASPCAQPIAGDLADGPSSASSVSASTAAAPVVPPHLQLLVPSPGAGLDSDDGSDSDDGGVDTYVASLDEDMPTLSKQAVPNHQRIKGRTAALPDVLVVNVEVVTSTLVQDHAVHTLVSPPSRPTAPQPLDAVTDSDGTLLRSTSAITVFKSRRSILRALSLLFSRYYQSTVSAPSADSGVAAATALVNARGGGPPLPLPSYMGAGVSLSMPPPSSPMSSHSRRRLGALGATPSARSGPRRTAKDRHILHSLCTITTDVFARLWDDALCAPMLTTMSDEDTWDMLPPRLVWHTLAHMQRQLALCAPFPRQQADRDSARDVAARAPLLTAWCAVLASAARHVHRTGAVFGVASDGDVRRAAGRTPSPAAFGDDGEDDQGDRMCSDPLAVLAESTEAALAALASTYAAAAASHQTLSHVLHAGLEPSERSAPSPAARATPPGDATATSVPSKLAMSRISSASSLMAAARPSSVPMTPSGVRPRDSFRWPPAARPRTGPTPPRSALPSSKPATTRARPMSPSTRRNMQDTLEACVHMQRIALQCLTRLLPACLSLVPPSVVLQHAVPVLQACVPELPPSLLSKWRHEQQAVSGQQAPAVPDTPSLAVGETAFGRDGTPATTVGSVRPSTSPSPARTRSVPPSPANIRSAEAAAAAQAAAAVTSGRSVAGADMSVDGAQAAAGRPTAAAPAVPRHRTTDAAAQTLAHLLSASRHDVIAGLATRQHGTAGDSTAASVVGDDVGGRDGAGVPRGSREDRMRRSLLTFAVRCVHHQLQVLHEDLAAASQLQGQQHAGSSGATADAPVDDDDAVSMASGSTLGTMTSHSTATRSLLTRSSVASTRRSRHRSSPTTSPSGASVSSTTSSTPGKVGLVTLPPGLMALLRVLFLEYLPQQRTNPRTEVSSKEPLSMLVLLQPLLDVVVAAAAFPPAQSIASVAALHAAALLCALVGGDRGASLRTCMLHEYSWQEAHRLALALVSTLPQLHAALIMLHTHPEHPAHGDGDATKHPSRVPDQWLSLHIVRLLHSASDSHEESSNGGGEGERARAHVAPSLRDSVHSLQVCMSVLLHVSHRQCSVESAGSDKAPPPEDASVRRAAVTSLMQTAFDTMAQLIQDRSLATALASTSASSSTNGGAASGVKDAMDYEGVVWGQLCEVLAWHRAAARSTRAVSASRHPASVTCDVPALVAVLLRLVWVRCERAQEEAAARGDKAWAPTADDVWVASAAEALMTVFAMEHDQSLRMMKGAFGPAEDAAAAFVTRPPASVLETELLRTFVAWIVASLYREEDEANDGQHKSRATRIVWRDRRAITRVLAVISAFQPLLLAKATSEAGTGDSDSASGHSGSGSGSGNTTRHHRHRHHHRNRRRKPTPPVAPGPLLAEYCHHLSQRLLQFRHYVAVLRLAPVACDAPAMRESQGEVDVLTSADPNSSPEALRALMTTACSIDAVFCPPIADALVRVLGGSSTLLEDEEADSDASDDPYADLPVEEKWRRMEEDFLRKAQEGSGDSSSTAGGGRGHEESKGSDGKEGGDGATISGEEEGDGGLEDGVAVAHTLAYKACVCHELWANNREWYTHANDTANATANAAGAATGFGTPGAVADVQAKRVYKGAVPLTPLKQGQAARALVLTTNMQAGAGTFRTRRWSVTSSAVDGGGNAADGSSSADRQRLRSDRLQVLDGCYRAAILALDIAQEWRIAKHMCSKLREVYLREASIQQQLAATARSAADRAASSRMSVATARSVASRHETGSMAGRGAGSVGPGSDDASVVSGSVASASVAPQLAPDFKLHLEEIKVLEEKISSDHHHKPHLQPLYCAVHFTGHSFPLIERDNWFIYRLQEATHSAALVHTLQERYPFAQVFNPRYPLVIAKPKQAAGGAGGGATVAGSVAGSGAAEGGANEGSMRFHGVAVDPQSPVDDHIYVYPAVLVNSGTIKKTVRDARGQVRQVTAPGSQFRVWVSRTAAKVGVASLNAANDPNRQRHAATTPAKGGGAAMAAASGHAGVKDGSKADNAVAEASEDDTTYIVSDLGPCLLAAYDKKEDPDELLGRTATSPVCTVDLFIENQQIKGTRRGSIVAAPGAGSFINAANYQSVFVSAHLPWVTRRCAVTRTFIRAVPLVSACIDWLQAYRDLLANRIRWVYHATLYTGKPAFGGEAAGDQNSKSTYPFRDLPGAPAKAQEEVDLSAYGQGSGKQPSVFGAGAAALMSPFGFGRGRSSRGFGGGMGNDRGESSGATWLEESKSKPGGNMFVYKGFRTLSYSPSLRAMGALGLPDDEQPVPRPHISKHLDRFARQARRAEAARQEQGDGAAAEEGELISPMRHATLSLSGLEVVRKRNTSDVSTGDFPNDDDDDAGDGDGNDDEGYEVVGATAAAKVMYGILEESLSDMAFVCGLRTCNQLVNDYREIFHVWRTKTRTRKRKEFIRSRKAAIKAGKPAPEMPDFEKLIKSQPHWTIVRVKRGMAGMKPLIEEALSLHGQLLDMDNVPTLPQQGPRGSPLHGVGEAVDVDDDSDSAAEEEQRAQSQAVSRQRREARLTALMNGVTEGFVVG